MIPFVEIGDKGKTAFINPTQIICIREKEDNEIWISMSDKTIIKFHNISILDLMKKLHIPKNCYVPNTEKKDANDKSSRWPSWLW